MAASQTEEEAPTDDCEDVEVVLAAPRTVSVAVQQADFVTLHARPPKVLRAASHVAGRSVTPQRVTPLRC